MEQIENLNTKPILIIDDEKDICFMLSNIIRNKSLKTTAVVHSIDEATNWLKTKKPSLIFLDNNLPDGKGVDYLPNLKRLLPEIKIIMITAYDTPADRRMALENGADEFIGKPFSGQSIFGVVEKFLK